MKIQENSKKPTKHAPVGEFCTHCNTICDASAILGMQVDFAKLMGSVAKALPINRFQSSQNSQRILR